jgi:hypothetical protein
MKYLITTIILAVSLQAYGQFVEGDKVLGGGFSWQLHSEPKTSNGTANRSRSLNVSPIFGMLVNPSLEFGVRVSYGVTFNETTHEVNGQPAQVSESNYTSPSLGLYARKYFSLADIFLFSVAGEISYGTSSSSTKITNVTTGVVFFEEERDRRNIGVAIRPQFTFLASQNWAIQLGIGHLGYSFIKDKTEGDTQNNFTAGYDIVGLDVTYYFRKAGQ